MELMGFSVLVELIDFKGDTSHFQVSSCEGDPVVGT